MAVALNIMPQAFYLFIEFYLQWNGYVLLCDWLGLCLCVRLYVRIYLCTCSQQNAWHILENRRLQCATKREKDANNAFPPPQERGKESECSGKCKLEYQSAAHYGLTYISFYGARMLLSLNSCCWSMSNWLSVNYLN